MKLIGKQHGLTLIEVLIALAIISIAMTALIQAATQNIRATAYLQTKMVATWVAQEITNEILTGLITLNDETVRHQKIALNHIWYWHADRAETPNAHIQKITVDIYSSEDATVSSAEMVSYRYVS